MWVSPLIDDDYCAVMADALSNYIVLHTRSRRAHGTGMWYLLGPIFALVCNTGFTEASNKLPLVGVECPFSRMVYAFFAI